MANALSVQDTETAPAIVACTVSRDVTNFDLLIEDMEAELGETWGDLGFEDALAFFDQPEAAELRFIAVAVDEDDESDLGQLATIITRAKAQGIQVIVIADGLGPTALHHLLRLGADDFVPYPLPEKALHEAIARLETARQAPQGANVRQLAPVAPPHAPETGSGLPPQDAEARIGAAPEPARDPAGAEAAAQPAPQPPAQSPAQSAPLPRGSSGHDGVVLAVHGMAGGVGATTLAVNLAWELASIAKQNAPRVCLLDLDIQLGSVATYLDLPRREAVFDLLSDTSSLDADMLEQAMVPFNERLKVLTAPAEMLPLDIVESADINRIIDTARASFDFVVIDMPTTVVSWTEAVLNQSHVYFVPIELDMRSAQNTLRMIRALRAEELPVEKLRYALNRAPKFSDLAAKSRVKRLAESLDIKIELQLPDGGRAVTQSNDHGLPLASSAAKNPVRKEIFKLAKSIFDLNRAAETARPR